MSDELCKETIAALAPRLASSSWPAGTSNPSVAI